MTPDVSICIATFRRPKGLARLLGSLARQKLPDGLELEIIVVDNDSAGRARGEAIGVCEIAQRVRWFVEPRQNIALARNRAVVEARGKWIAFVDDDEITDPNWLAGFWAEVQRNQGDAFFGPVFPRFDTRASSWLDFETLYSRAWQLTGEPVEIGAARTSNSLVRRSLFADCLFDPAWGLTGGEDVELFDRMFAAGARLRWCDEAIVHETIPVQRQRLGWLAQRAFRGGVGYTRLQRQRRRGGAIRRGLPRAMLALLYLSVLLPFSPLAGRSAMLRVGLRICTQAGHLWAFAGRSYEEYSDWPTTPSLE